MPAHNAIDHFINAQLAAAKLTPAPHIEDWEFARRASLDVVVANAGVTRDGLLMRMTDEEFEHVILTQDWHPLNHASFAANHPMYPKTRMFTRAATAQSVKMMPCVDSMLVILST